MVVAVLCYVLLFAEIAAAVVPCCRPVVWQKYTACCIVSASLLVTVIIKVLLYLNYKQGSLPLNDAVEVFGLLCTPFAVGLCVLAFYAVSSKRSSEYENDIDEDEE